MAAPHGGPPLLIYALGVYLNLKFAECVVLSFRVSTIVRHVPAQALSVFQLYCQLPLPRYVQAGAAARVRLDG
jgi:hypothetical protein